MKNIRVSRFINWCGYNSSVNKVLVISNNKNISNEIIRKLKEFEDLEYINFNKENELLKFEGLNYDTVVLGYGWYFNNEIVRNIKGLIFNKKVFEIDLDDLVSNDIEYNKESKSNKLKFKIELDKESISKVNGELDNIKNKLISINEEINVINYLPGTKPIDLAINGEIIAKGIKQINLSSNNRTEAFFRAMTKEQYIAFSIQESKKVLTQQQIKNISRFFDDVSNGYGFVICTRYNQLIGPDKFAEYVGIEKMDSQKGEVNNNEEK